MNDLIKRNNLFAAGYELLREVKQRGFNELPLGAMQNFESAENNKTAKRTFRLISIDDLFRKAQGKAVKAKKQGKISVMGYAPL